MAIVSSVLASCPGIVWAKATVSSTVSCQLIAPLIFDLFYSSPEGAVPACRAKRVILNASLHYLCTAASLLTCNISLLTPHFYILLLVLWAMQMLLTQLRLLLTRIGRYISFVKSENNKILQEKAKKEAVIRLREGLDLTEELTKKMKGEIEARFAEIEASNYPFKEDFESGAYTCKKNGITYFKHDGWNGPDRSVVFSVENFPGYIFKMYVFENEGKNAKQEYQYKTELMAEITKLSLDRIKIPPTDLLELEVDIYGNTRAVIVEKEEEIDHDVRALENIAMQLASERPEEYRSCLQQLTRLSESDTGLMKISYRDTPLILDKKEGKCCIIILSRGGGRSHFKESSSAVVRYYCQNENHTGIVMSSSQKNSKEDLSKDWQLRLKQLNSDAFIKKGPPISLKDLTDDEIDQIVKLSDLPSDGIIVNDGGAQITISPNEAVREIVRVLENEIQKNTTDEEKRNQRHVVVSAGTSNSPLYKYYDRKEKEEPLYFASKESLDQNLYLNKVLRALIKIDYIHDFDFNGVVGCYNCNYSGPSFYHIQC